MTIQSKTHWALLFVGVLCARAHAAEQAGETADRLPFQQDPEIAEVLGQLQLTEVRTPTVSMKLLDMCYETARRDDAAKSERSVDYYYQAAAFAWSYLFDSEPIATDEASRNRAYRVYHRSLARLINLGQQYGRLDPTERLSINTPDGWATIPTAHHGFPWRPEDFTRVEPASEYRSDDMSHHYRRDGMGVALVAIRESDRDEARAQFLDLEHPFAATAFLRPSVELLFAADGGDAGSEAARLELYDPYRIREAAVGNQQIPLAYDISAPLANIQNQADEWSIVRAGFEHPGTTEEFSGLFMIEPYQPGKIPVVLVHGLLSGGLIWLDVANELRADPFVNERYQIWVYSYPTGRAFLGSAADFRNDLKRAVQMCDDRKKDPATSEMVLIGHSMGGLLSYCQVTDSDTTLWDEFAIKPLEEMEAAEETTTRLRDVFFFDALPFVKRAVFVGTPHRGAPFIDSCIGKFLQRRIRSPQESTELYDSLMRENPGAFTESAWSYLPTSIDLTSTRSMILDGMLRLTVNPDVKLHSIIGTKRRRIVRGPNDGLVPVWSAKLAHADSTTYVWERHIRLHQHPDSVREIKRILQEHADQ